MEQDIAIYTKPIVNGVCTHLLRWPRTAAVARVKPRVSWVEFLPQTTIISKTVAVHAPAKKVWELIGDPENIPTYCAGVVSVEMIDEKTYMVTDTVPPKRGDIWGQERFKEEVIERSPEKLIKYRVYADDGMGEDYTFELTPHEDTTIVNMKMEADFKLENHNEVEEMMEGVLMDIARLSMSKEDILRRIKEFESRKKLLPSESLEKI